MAYPKPLAFRGLNTFFRLGQVLQGVPRALDPEKLKRKAMQRTRLKNFGDDYYQEGLEVLCESLNRDSRVNAYGYFLAESTLVSFLETRLLLQRKRDRNDPVLQTRLIDPIIVSGLARTGTTALHRMLASAPLHRGLEWWELNLPMNRTVSDSREDRIKTAEAIIRPRELFTPHLDAMHYIRPHTLEECFWLMGGTFASRTMTEFMVCYGYLDWYFTKANADKKYQDYADLLRILQAEYPGQRLVVKSIEHLENPHLILKHIPNAKLIQTHRKPVECVPSYISLNAFVVDLTCSDLDLHRHGRAVLDVSDRSLSAHLRNRAGLEGKIYDHLYTDMLKDPVGSVRKVFDFFGLRWTDEVARTVGLHTREHQQHKYGRHTYAVGDFGLTEAEINDRFKDYIQTYLPAA
ncbi:MAG: sulfotransferase [Rhodobacter sp.]|nr:sulfotransferase [Paracoccaceae bacterium]MCC0080326.1 sulfotransferase [Rhodobacter sp.]